ncbi:MAG: thioredoxin family protein [Desulfobacterales bacterium]|nr:MAG: thioredoxin family protein [Desulfobacterales bacterium]
MQNRYLIWGCVLAAIPVILIGCSSAASAATPNPATGTASAPFFSWTTLGALLAIFAAGVALNLTPCVYPLIPITVSYFAGRSARKRSRLALHGLCYIGGLAVANSMLGVTAALTGSLMGAMLQNPWVLVAVAAILLVFAASLLGLWDLRLPAVLSRVAAKSYTTQNHPLHCRHCAPVRAGTPTTSYTGYLGTLLMGLTLGMVAAPCAGPFVLGLLTWGAGMGNPWQGFIIFCALSLGLGLPLFFLALFSGKLNELPHSGEWLSWVRKLLGWALVGMAVYYVKPLFPEAIRAFLAAAVVLAAGLHLAWIDKTRTNLRLFARLKTACGFAGVAWAVFFIGSWAVHRPVVQWQPYSEQLIAEAQKSGQPVMIEFYANWCPNCLKLERRTFRDPVFAQATTDFIKIKVDLTKRGDPIHEHLVAKYEIMGVPTIVFLDNRGNERRDLRIVSYLGAEEFRHRTVLIRKDET